MRRLGRLRLSLAFLACVLGSALASGPAAAQGPPDPQTTNIPYLAWRGEQIRLVKCDPAIGEEGASVDWLVEEWTGPGLKPQIETSTITGFEDCVAADIVSLEPGLARVKLVVSDESGTAILKHQFLSIWMSLNKPSIDEVGQADPTGNSRLGDPPGDGIFTAGDLNGRIQVKVTGTFPGHGGISYTLPDAWPALASVLADDSDSDPDNNAARWDIHDDLAKTEGHVSGYCGPGTAVVDAVDNCKLPSTASGPFSRVYGDSSGPNTVGPFDPLVLSTLLGDGNLNAGDAPMPAARVDVQIAKNTGGTDIGGVGSLEPADKAEVYSRDTNGTASAHNYYAPFYSAWIPATSRPGLSSGIDGPAQGNNFRGFLVDGQYDYWEFAEVLRSEVARSTQCLRRTDQAPAYRQTPAGPQNVAVYTDEHGEAQVEYNPGTGAYYDAVGAIKNDNGGCDLEDVDLLGRSVITATARYPYQPVSDPAKASDPLTKQVKSLFTKYLGYFTKGPGTANSTARIVVAHAQDVDGRAFANERVCFFVDDEADGAFGFSGTTGPANARFTVGGSDAPLLGNAPVCRYTDANGNAAVEVINSDPQSINVVAYFVPEGILRDIDVEFGTAATPTPPGDFDDDPPARGAEGTNPPTESVLKSVGATSVKKKAKKAVSSSIRVARLVKKGGKVYLVVKVKSNVRYAKLRVKVLNKHGRKMAVKTKRIRTNRTVKLRLSAKAQGAAVSIVR
ncbi:MAG: hypothetical protein JW895_01925 [Thermoleophilaceae bacterium]|nr:hypothetical protein [Thermoleophilaceae bacterium]